MSALAAIFVLALAIFWTYFPREKLKAAAIEEISKRLNQNVTIAGVSIDFYPGIELVAKEVHISDRETAEELATIDMIRLDLNILQLLCRKLSLENVVINSPEIHLVHKRECGWNIQKIFRNLKNENGNSGKNINVGIKPIRIQNGLAIICDDTFPEPLTIEDIDGVFDAENQMLILHSARLILPFLTAQFSGKISELDTPDPLLAIVAKVQLAGDAPLALIKNNHLPAHASAADICLKISGRIRRPFFEGYFSVNPLVTAGLKTAGNMTGNLQASEARLELQTMNVSFGKSRLEGKGKCDNIWSKKKEAGFQGKATFVLDDVFKITGKNPLSRVQPKGFVTAGFQVEGDEHLVELSADLNLLSAAFNIPSLLKKETGMPANLTINARYKPPQELIVNNFLFKMDETKVEGNANISLSKKPWISADLKSADFPLKALNLVPSIKFKEGGMTFAAHVSQETPDSKELKFESDGAIKNALVSCKLLSQPVRNLNASVAVKNNKAIVNGASFSLGASTFDTELRVSDFENPYIGGSIRASELDINELLAALRKEEGDSVLEPSSQGGKNLSLRLLIEANSVYAGSTRTGPVSTVWTLENQVHCFEPLTLKAFGGTIRGNLKLDTSADKLKWRTKFSGKHMKLERVMAEFHPEKTRATGTLDAEGQLSGSAGEGKEEFLRSIGGELRVKAKDGDIKQYAMLRNIYLLMQLPLATAFLPGVGEIALANTLIDAAKTRGRSLDPTDVAYEKMGGMFLFSKGVAHTEDFRLESGVSDLLFAGDIDMPRNRMDMTVKATPLGSIGSLMGDIPIAGNGLKKVKEIILSTDFIVRGPISDPQVKLEAAQKIFGNGK
jgi:hypothetical protein